MMGRRVLIVSALAVAVVAVARGGHEVPIYPSYYPHEIKLSTLAPKRAAELLLAGEIQAYVGGRPRFAAAPPASVSSVESLGSFIIVRVNPSSSLIKDSRSACAMTEAVVRYLAGKSDQFVFHPYPVTPLHGDYLHYVDLAEAAKAASVGGRRNSAGRNLEDLKVRATGDVAKSLIRSEWTAPQAEWDVEVAEVGAAKLIASAGYSMNGWLGPDWLRKGWFHAALLLGGQTDEALKRRVAADLERLQTGNKDNMVDRINLERSLVSALAAGCQTRVAGYTVKREYFSTVFTAGIENISYDVFAGFNSPIFLRTVKLRDFPWNGWLALGLPTLPAAAWNPIAGFGDEFGQLMWSAVADPALIPAPYGSDWMLNRITDVRSSARR